MPTHQQYADWPLQLFKNVFSVALVQYEIMHVLLFAALFVDW